LDGTPAGTVSVWPRGTFGWIDDVATHPDFRMQGIGRTMIFEACKRAMEARCEWIVLISDLFDTPQVLWRLRLFKLVYAINAMRDWRRWRAENNYRLAQAHAQFSGGNTPLDKS